MRRDRDEWAVIRKAEGGAEERLAAALREKFAEMGFEMLKDEALNLLTAGNFEGLMRLLDVWKATTDWAQISKIIFETSREAGVGTMSEAVRAAQARFEAQAVQVPVLIAVGPITPPFLPATPPLPLRGLIDISFNALDANVAAWAEARAANLVVQISEDMRLNIRAHILDAVKGSTTAAETARKLAKVIPLHSRYARAVLNREATLFDGFVKGGMDATKARIKAASMADKYAAKLTRLRARTIARTEIQFATNHGQYIGYETAMNSGTMRPSVPGTLLVTKEWVTAEDEDVCKVCGPLNGQQVAFDALFPGGINHPPSHPNCRCSYNVIDNLDQIELEYAS